MMSKKCELMVKDGKVYCKTCGENHQGSFEQETWDSHRLCKTVTLPFRHVLYVAELCEEHQQLLLDADQ